MADERFTNSQNRDPVTERTGAHPVGTGVGAAGGAVAGAAAGAMGGPIGMAVGGVAGAVVGGMAGRAAAASINPTEEEDYWRNAYASEPYYRVGHTYDDYRPAYEMGWSSRARYGNDFDTYDSQLASEWDSRRGSSRLQWSDARNATRAAWDRVDRGLGGADNSPADNDDVADTLNDLIETCRDGEFGFNACAEHAKAMELKSVFQQRATDCSKAAAELRAHVLRLGGSPTESGTTAGAMHRGWVAVRSSLTGYDDSAMLDECERGEDHALAAYRKALKQSLPGDIHALVQRQMDGAQRNHDQIKGLRDQYKARS